MNAGDDPILARAIRLARRAFCQASSVRLGEDRPVDGLDEVISLGRAAIDHLDAGRWDEARAAGDAAIELAEELGEGTRWRDFALRVEEACETAPL